MDRSEYTPDLDMLLRTRLPTGWVWGCSQSAYQTEGGMNDGLGPANDWYEWETSGRVESTGSACDFWRRPDRILDRVVAAGLSALRISIEWARIEPQRGEVDGEALDGYVDLLSALHDRGVDPHICLWHFTHPRWLGTDPWVTDPEGTAALFRAHVRRTAEHVCRGLTARGYPVPRFWLTLNELNIAPLAAHVFGTTPPGRRGNLAGAWRMYDALGCAHVAAYEELHDAYAAGGWPAPMVSTNNSAVGLYELDFLLLDILTRRIDHDRRAAEFDRALAAAPRAPYGLMSAAFERGAASIWRRARSRGLLTRTQRAVAATRRERVLDWVAADWYTPFLTDLFRPPGRRAGPGGARVWSRQSLLWEQRPNPAGVRWYLNLCGRYGLPVILVESGMCSPGRNPRPDGWDRATFLKANVGAVLAALDDGVPMLGYMHWSITDNYEWGSYLPRFGMHACERDGDTVLIADTDAMGGRPAEVMREIIMALPPDAHADRATVAAAFAAGS